MPRLPFRRSEPATQTTGVRRLISLRCFKASTRSSCRRSSTWRSSRHGRARSPQSLPSMAIVASIPLAPCPPDSPRFPRTRGKVRPRAIAWFGFSSFWGHLRHLLASAIATDSVDSRQWMVPEAPAELLGRIAAVLGPRGARDAATLAATMGGEVWIDFIADTGDDCSVSEAVARLLAADY